MISQLIVAAFLVYFSQVPVRLIGRDRFVRNVLIAIGNSGDAGLADAAERRLEDMSPLVRGAAVWALAQLIQRERFETLASKAMASETDESVREEWRLASSVVRPSI